MSREAHVRFREGLGVKLPRPTHPEVATLEGKLYLCVVIDLYSKLVVGWSMHHRQDRHMVVRAVQMAVWQRQGSSEVILHSDRGGQLRFKESSQHRFVELRIVVSRALRQAFSIRVFCEACC